MDTLQGTMLVYPSDGIFKNKFNYTDVANWVLWEADTEMESKRMFIRK